MGAPAHWPRGSECFLQAWRHLSRNASKVICAMLCSSSTAAAAFCFLKPAQSEQSSSKGARRHKEEAQGVMKNGPWSNSFHSCWNHVVAQLRRRFLLGRNAKRQGQLEVTKPSCYRPEDASVMRPTHQTAKATMSQALPALSCIWNKSQGIKGISFSPLTDSDSSQLELKLCRKICSRTGHVF